MAAEGHANFLLGQKSLDRDWDPVDDQGLIGAELSWGLDGPQIHIATDIIASADEEDIIGLSARYSDAVVNLFGQEFDAGGTSFGFLLGFGWPGR